MVEPTHAWANQDGKPRECPERRSRVLVASWLAASSSLGGWLATAGLATGGKAIHPNGRRTDRPPVTANQPGHQGRRSARPT